MTAPAAQKNTVTPLSIRRANRQKSLRHGLRGVALADQLVVLHVHFGHTQYLPIALPLFALLAGALALLLILVQIRVLRYAYTVLLDAANAIRNTAPRVLLLLCLRERFGIWAFDADEDNKEIRILHHLQKLRVIGQIQRCLGREHVRKVMLLLPFDEMRQESFHSLLILLPIRLSSTKSRWPR